MYTQTRKAVTLILGIVAIAILTNCAMLPLGKATHKIIVNTGDFTLPLSVAVPIDTPNFFQSPYEMGMAIPFSNFVIAVLYSNSMDDEDSYVLGIVMLKDKLFPYALYIGEQFYIYPDPEGPPVPCTMEEFDLFHYDIVEKANIINLGSV